MAFLHLAPQLDPAAQEPMALQLARLLVGEILAGHLAHGAMMPGSRSLAQDLGLSRHVVMSALWELELEGWVQSKPGSGTYVAQHPPSAMPSAWGAQGKSRMIPPEPGFGLPSQLQPLSTQTAMGLDLSEAFPDPRLAPQDALGRAYQRAIQRHGDALLGQGEPQGNHALREQLAIHLRHVRGLQVEAENLLITRNTAMSLTLVAQALAPTGGHIAVEDPGDPRAWEALGATGGRLHSVSVDQDGVDPEALAALASKHSLAMLYLSPRRQIPTTVSLSPQRREAVQAVAQRHGFALLENDPDAELTWAGAAPLPLAAEDPEGRVIHLGSLSQLLAPGLGLAYLAGPARFVERLARLRRRMDIQGDRVLEWAVADLIRDGDFERHLARSRKILRDRHGAFMQGLAELLGEDFAPVPCGGGQSCWVSAPPQVDVDAWCERCLAAGVKIRPGSYYDFQRRSRSNIRLGFAHLESVEARAALRILQCQR